MLEIKQAVEILLSLCLVLRKNHGAHHIDTIGLKEHMLSAAQAYALGTQLTRLGGIGGCFRIGAYFQAPMLVCPREQGLEVVAVAGLDFGDIPQHHFAGGAIECNNIAALHYHTIIGSDRAGLVVDRDTAAAGDGTHTHTPGDHSCVRGHATQFSENASGHFHAVNIFRRGLAPHQYHTRPCGVYLYRFLCGEHDLAGSAARACRQPGGNDVSFCLWVNHGVQEGLDMLG